MSESEPNLGAGQVHPKTGQWEFGHEFDFDFGELSRTMRFVGTMMVVFGVLAILGAVLIVISGNDNGDLLKGAVSLIEGIIMIVIGGWTRSASNSFDAITQTEGNDLDYLMNAVKDLRRIYTLQYVLFIVGTIILVLALLASLLLIF